MGGEYVEGSLYYYAPNKGAPVIFAFLFLVSFVIHIRQSAKYNSWKITLMLPWCALTFGAGYILREVGAFNYGNANIYIASMTIIYSAPPLYEMSNYQVLGRLLYYIPYHSPIHPGRMLTTMLGLSTIVETLNGNGVSYWANIKLSDGKQDMGKRFLKAALILQLVVLIGFLSLTAFFHYQCKKKGPFPKNVKGVLLTLYCSSVLIGIRAIYRTVEYYTVSTFRYTPAMSSFAPSIIRYEAFFWIFEALLMLTNSVLLNVRHPMRFLPKNSKVHLAEDGITEMVGPGYEDLRFFLIAMVDPFDLIGIIMGRHMSKEFWKTDATLKEEVGSPVVKEVEKDSDVEKATGVDLNGDSIVMKEAVAIPASIVENTVVADTIRPEAGNEKDREITVKTGATAASSSQISQHDADHDIAGP